MTMELIEELNKQEEIMIFCCCCLGSGIGSLFSIIGIFWMLDNAGKMLKIAGIIILGIVGLYLLYVFLSSIVYAIEAKIKEKKRLDWESYKRHAMWGSSDT